MTTMTITVAAFYKFVTIDDLEDLQFALGAFCCARAIQGTILLAAEGINATVSGTAGDIGHLLQWLRSDRRFQNLDAKLSFASEHPFKRLKVKIKPEIVTFGVPAANPARAVGRYIAPKDWNALIADPDVVVVDTRNAYEVKIGTFEGAIDPQTRAFSDFPDYVAANLDPARNPKVAMFCTGGIRCEKASSYLLSQGFREVFHLEGGILKYLETVPPEESMWRGECFVFDERVALQHGVRVGTHALCPNCGEPVPNPSAAETLHECTGE